MIIVKKSNRLTKPHNRLMKDANRFTNGALRLGVEGLEEAK